MEWARFGGKLALRLGMKVDGLTAVMFVVVTSVSLLVQIYSTGYMRGDARYTWFFAALSLFTAGMLDVVIADNLIQLLIGWEIIGLCSYFLIGHYWEEKENSDAGIKAFITTRIGDVGFLLGIFTLFSATRTFSIDGIIRAVESGQVSPGWVTAGAVLLFCGAIGKSAQFPLHVWLPDAMAGPTPVSALIHAATMVAAGVFLVGRMFPVFSASTPAMNEIAILASITMLISALMALVQDDIKKVLAYSTISQLAYMMAGLAVGAYSAGIFHLFTHAFFKALLFLAAGSVIHAVHSNNLSDMGGLRRAMPWTFVTFAIGSLALAGIPPFGGFWSKDEIIGEAFKAGFGGEVLRGASPAVARVVFVVALVTAFLTAFYMARAVRLAFFGAFRGHGQPRESEWRMTGVLVALAIPAALAGLAGAPFMGRHAFGSWIAAAGESVHHSPSLNLSLAGLSAGLALVAIWVAWRVYSRVSVERDPMLGMGGLTRLLVNKFYLDELYSRGIIRPIQYGLSAVASWLDRRVVDGVVNAASVVTRGVSNLAYDVMDQKVIDGAVNGLGRTAKSGGSLLKYLQTGQVQWYAAMLVAGVVVLAAVATR